MIKRSRLAVLLVPLALVAAACGSDDDADTGSETTDGATETTDDMSDDDMSDDDMGEGIDIAMVLNISGSMRALDFEAEDRLGLGVVVPHMDLVEFFRPGEVELDPGGRIARIRHPHEVHQIGVLVVLVQAGAIDCVLRTDARV